MLNDLIFFVKPRLTLGSQLAVRGLIQDYEVEDEIPLGSLLLLGNISPENQPIFPDRIALETGHRIPIELFPTATQDRLQESRAEEKYINTSTFRRFQPTTTKTTTTSTASTVSTTTEVSIEEDRARTFSVGAFLSDEGDNTYERSLHVFAPSSFF
ncbi:uncharacterized protein LOC111697117 isoform X2 [Eurytemora carolleeae]|uniref:uncharacterized protein LOC111697117 isoform X2 n=1 Tax=Eurytemora carolleeae TaxID=1294199 RepID=UPI000C771191|nr:uncharacterized protein LOC111697117 isoform X2 [Eurytemora carolleeae]|eukprot:XP_023322774.1 uncharacterized protein LOC111697117 isoform X2 [Eurytemora affinis]